MVVERCGIHAASACAAWQDAGFDPLPFNIISFIAMVLLGHVGAGKTYFGG